MSCWFYIQVISKRLLQSGHP